MSKIKNLLFTAFMGAIIINAGACKNTQTPEPPEPKHPIIGTWYEVGSTENSGKKIVFMKTTFTVISYYKNIEEYNSYNETPYILISENEIKMSNLLETYMDTGYYWPPRLNGEHTTSFKFNNDTLIIERFKTNSVLGIPYPANMYPIYLIRSING